MLLSITGNSLSELQGLALEVGSGTYVFDANGGGKLGEIITARQRSRNQRSLSSGSYAEAGAPIYNFQNRDSAGCGPTGCWFAGTHQNFTGVSY